MKRTVVLVLCLLLVSTTVRATAQGVAPESSVQDPPLLLEKYTLPNGLRVWCQPRPDSESVAALLVLRAGSRFESTSNNGISHYVEHMVFTGTERWSEEEIKEIITRRGGRWNGWTGRETATYYAHMSAEDLDLALEWLAEVVFHATFPADKVDKERQVIFQERWGHYGWLINTLDALGFGYELARDVRRVLFSNSTLGLDVIGEDASLESLDRGALLDYYNRHYTPDNAVLIVVGGVTAEQALDRVEKHFGDLEQTGRPPAPDTPPLPAQGPHQVIVRGPLPTDQVELRMGARTVGRTHPDRWALQVLAKYLDRDLTEEIRYQQGLVYSLGAYNVLYDDAGYFVITTTSERRNRETILRIIEANLDRVRQGEIDPERVAEAQAALKGLWALSMEDNMERALWLAEWATVLSAGEQVPDYQASIDAVTPEDMSRVVATYFTPQRSYVGLHLPVATVASGARAFAVVVGLPLLVWGVHRLRHRAKTKQKER